MGNFTVVSTRQRACRTGGARGIQTGVGAMEMAAVRIKK